MRDSDGGRYRALESLLFDRHSCRAFLPDRVPRAEIEKMLALAQRSASWCNTQPWQLTVTEGAGTERFRTALHDHASARLGAGDVALDPDIPFPQRYNGVYDQRRREVGGQLYEAVGVARGDRAGSIRQSLENFRFFGAPHVLLIHVDRDLGAYGAVDCGVFLGTLLLAAESLGIAMIPQAALASYSGLVREHFGISETMSCVAGASFGYADCAHPANGFRASRAGIADAVRWVGE